MLIELAAVGGGGRSAAKEAVYALPGTARSAKAGLGASARNPLSPNLDAKLAAIVASVRAIGACITLADIAHPAYSK